MTRSESRAEVLRPQGAQAAIADAFDGDALSDAVAAARPAAAIHQLTDIPAAINPRRYEGQMATNDELLTGWEPEAHREVVALVGRLACEFLINTSQLDRLVAPQPAAAV